MSDALARLGGAAPLIAYSFSSRGFPDMVERVRQLLPSIHSTVLLSLFDLWHLDGLTELLTTAEAQVRIWDSGGYETKLSDDVSSIVSAIPSISPWTLQHYIQAAQRIPWNGRDIVVSFDNIPPSPVGQQLESAFEGFEQIDGDYLKDVLLHVPADCDIPRLVKEIQPYLSRIDIIGFTEKEIAPTWIEGVRFVHKFHRAFAHLNLQSPPMHLFGCLDPKSVIYFTLAGVKIFDGLSWLRYFFHHGTTLYRREFEFSGDFRGIHPTQDIDVAISLHNMNEMQQLHADLNFQLSVDDDSIFADEKRVLQSILNSKEND